MMDAKDAKKIVDYVFNDVFGRENQLSLEEMEKVFAYDLPLPGKIKSVLSGDYTWGIFEDKEKVISYADFVERKGKDDFMDQKKPIKSMDDLLKAWGKINYHLGERYLDSNEAAESDGIYESHGVYRSTLQFGCQNIVYGYGNNSCKYLVASRDNNACVSGIGLDQSKYTSSSYDAIWSSKVSKSMFIRDGSDLYECMFCSELRSKKYCIANMQFEKDEYFKIKEMVIDWLMEDFKKRAKG